MVKLFPHLESFHHPFYFGIFSLFLWILERWLRLTSKKHIWKPKMWKMFSTCKISFFARFLGENLFWASKKLFRKIFGWKLFWTSKKIYLKDLVENRAERHKKRKYRRVAWMSLPNPIRWNSLVPSMNFPSMP